MSLIIMRGISGSGKSKISNTLFKPHNILSSDELRVELYGSMNVSPSLSTVWDELYRRLDMRCRFHVPTVFDATNLTGKSVKKVTDIAEMYGTEYHIVSIIPDEKSSIQTMDARRKGFIRGAVFDNSVLSQQTERYNNNTGHMRKKYEGKFFEGTFGECSHFVEQYIQQMYHHVVYDDVFIIGDLHGKIHKLRKMLNAIPKTALIYSAGDLIDRGEDSIGSVIELYNDSRFAGFSMGNHELNFIHESMGLKDCNSNARKKTHTEFESKSEEVQHRFMTILKTGKPYIVLENPQYPKKVLITHAGIEDFDTLCVNMHHCVGDRVNPYTGTNNTGFIQVHGHKSWEYTGDFTGNVVNVDSGCYDTGILTAFNPFTREIIHV